MHRYHFHSQIRFSHITGGWYVLKAFYVETQLQSQYQAEFRHKGRKGGKRKGFGFWRRRISVGIGVNLGIISKTFVTELLRDTCLTWAPKQIEFCQLS